MDTKLYTQPDMSTLITKTIQLNELRKLCEAAVQAAKEISDQDTKLAGMVYESLKKQQPYHCPTSPAPTATIHAAMTSAAKTVMTQYSTPPPLVTFYPPSLPPVSTNPYGPATLTTSIADTSPVIDLYTSYISPHARDFRGCLGCGDPNHQYKDCLKNRTEPHSTHLHQKLSCLLP
jgi:hypothetical protein